MNRDKLLAVKTIVVHDNCPDGLASFLILRDAYAHSGVAPDFVFLQHNTEAYRTLKAEPGMLFCDIIPPSKRAAEFVEVGAIVLDHHKKVEWVVKMFGENGVFADEVEDPGVSGATLAFREVWGPLANKKSTHNQPSFYDNCAVADFARFAGIRDTWQKKSWDWISACAQAEVLMFFPRDHWNRDLPTILRAWPIEYERLGRVLLARKEEATDRLLARVFRFQTHKGTRVAMVNNLHSSDLAERIDQDADLVIGFSYLTEKVENEQYRKLVLSTRSHTGYDCASFCEANGGGGHTSAAGCSLPLDSTPTPLLLTSLQTMSTAPRKEKELQ